jgi:hypothetical protein
MIYEFHTLPSIAVVLTITRLEEKLTNLGGSACLPVVWLFHIILLQVYFLYLHPK